MGASISKEDRSLLMCRERIRYVRQALDGRRSLAAALIAYTQALTNTGMALGKLVEPGATMPPQMSASQISISSPSSSQHVQTWDHVGLHLQTSPQSSAADHVAGLEEDEEEDDDEFNNPVCSKSLVRVFKNRYEMLNLGDESTPHPDLTPKSAPPVAVTQNILDSGKDPELLESPSSSMKEIEHLFQKASGFGSKQVPKMLDFRSVLPESQVHSVLHTSKRSAFLAPFLTCCTVDQTSCYTNNENLRSNSIISDEIKYSLTWNNPSPSPTPDATSRNDAGNMSSTSLLSDACMKSDSHTSTLDRLYAWERKLYDEVKSCGIVIKEFDIQCKHLRDVDSKAKRLDINRRGNCNKIDTIRATVKDLHSRIQIAIQRIDSISKIIQELRDNQLQPQLEDLIQRSFQMWKEMLDCHKRQRNIVTMLVDGSHGGSTTKFSATTTSESNREAATILEYQLNCLQASFMKWISTHRSYLQSINDWLLKCVDPIIIRHKYYSSRRRNEPQFSPVRDVAPPIYVTCRNWMEGLDKLPTMDVVDAIKGLLSVETVVFTAAGDQEKKQGEKRGHLNMLKKINDGHEPVNWRLDLGSLQCQLGSFLDRLTVFSEKSVIMYADLGSSVDSARNRYETWVSG